MHVYTKHDWVNLIFVREEDRMKLRRTSAVKTVGIDERQGSTTMLPVVILVVKNLRFPVLQYWFYVN
jgi:hypothetical protein